MQSKIRADALKYNLKYISAKYMLSVNDIKTIVNRPTQNLSIFDKRNKWFNNHISFISNMISQDTRKVITIKDMRWRFKNEFNKDISQTWIYRFITQKLRYSWKKRKIVSKNQLSDKNIKLRKEFVISFAQTIEQNYECVFIDETVFNSSTVQHYGWGLKGHELTSPINSLAGVYRIYSAITSKRLIGFMIFKGRTYTEDFTYFLTCIANEMKSGDSLDRIMFIMDNDAKHKSYHAATCLKNLNHMFLSPYTSFFNPIEEYFKEIKDIAKKKYHPNTLAMLKEITEGLNYEKEENIARYYIHAVKCMLKMIKNNI
jgi:hypothetical protein